MVKLLIKLIDDVLLSVCKYRDGIKKKFDFSYDDIEYIKAMHYLDSYFDWLNYLIIAGELSDFTKKHPINEIGSSHMARRTFIANIYNKVPDPNVIGSMTGHVEGSRAFSRYHTIEEKVKKDLVDIL